jgi:hypothetical protein
VLLTLCDNNELDLEYKNHGNTEYVEHEQDNDRSANIRGHFSNNRVNNEMLQLSNPSNNGEEDNEIKNEGDKLIYNNISSYLLIKQNKSTPGNNDSDADYEYDYDESHNIFNWSELIPTLVVYGVTMVIGIAGNSLIIFTICRYRRMKSTTNVFLASLASADLLLIIICIPVKVRSRTRRFSFQCNDFRLCVYP